MAAAAKALPSSVSRVRYAPVIPVSMWVSPAASPGAGHGYSAGVGVSAADMLSGVVLVQDGLENSRRLKTDRGVSIVLRRRVW